MSTPEIVAEASPNTKAEEFILAELLNFIIETWLLCPVSRA